MSYPSVWLHKICEKTGFLLPVFSCIRTKSTILSLYWKIRIRENTYFGIFYGCCLIVHQAYRFDDESQENVAVKKLLGPSLERCFAESLFQRYLLSKYWKEMLQKKLLTLLRLTRNRKVVELSLILKGGIYRLRQCFLFISPIILYLWCVICIVIFGTSTLIVANTWVEVE